MRGWTKEPCGTPQGDTVAELVDDLDHIKTAIVKPVLAYDTGKEVE